MNLSMFLANLYIVAALISLTISRGKITSWSVAFFLAAVIVIRNQPMRKN